MELHSNVKNWIYLKSNFVFHMRFKHSHSWQNHCLSVLFQTAVMPTCAVHLIATAKMCPKCP